MSLQNALMMKSILRLFELASGLKVNFYKNKVAWVVCEGDIVHTLAEKLK